MAPKRAKGELPKAMAALKESVGVDTVTAEAIAGASPDERKRAFAAMVSMLGAEFPDRKKLYEGCKCHQEKQEFMASVLMDV